MGPVRGDAGWAGPRCFCVRRGSPFPVAARKAHVCPRFSHCPLFRLLLPPLTAHPLSAATSVCSCSAVSLPHQPGEARSIVTALIQHILALQCLSR